MLGGSLGLRWFVCLGGGGELGGLAAFTRYEADI